MALGGTDLYRALLRGPVEGSPELRSAQGLLHTLMDSLSSAVFWKDRSSRYLGCNQTFAEIAGMPLEDLIGKTDDDMPWGRLSGVYTNWDERVMSEAQPMSDIIEPLITARGKKLWLSTNKAPLFDPGGSVIGVLGTFRDITEQTRAEQDLQRALTELDRRVKERTTQLERANENLRKEVDERVRLQSEERQLREYADVRRDIGAAMSRTLDLDKVLDTLLVGVQDLVASDLAAIVFVDERGGLEVTRLETAYGYELIDTDTTTETLRQHRSLTRPGQPVSSSSSSELLQGLGPALSSIAVEMTTGGVLIGYLILESRWSDFYVSDHGDRLNGIAEQAAAVVSNIRLTELAAPMAAAAERDRLSRDLHDSVVQTLAATALTVETELEYLANDDPARPAFERLQRLAANANLEIRALLREMRPALDRLDLADLISRLAGRDDWSFVIDVTADLETQNITNDEVVGLYRIVQEALTNAERYSKAKRVTIDLRDSPVVSISIVDDGVGFEPFAVVGDHMGLTIMGERAAELGADLDITSELGVGTSIRVDLLGCARSLATPATTGQG